MTDLRSQYEQMLQNVILITEMAMELKERAEAGDKYIYHLKNLAVRASRTTSSMHSTSKAIILLSHRLASTTLQNFNKLFKTDPNCLSIKQDYERLITILDKEMLDTEDGDCTDVGQSLDMTPMTISNAERLRHLESKQKFSEQNTTLPLSSTRSFRSDIDEKYPENWSRESLIDLSNVSNLPPVPENVFSDFSKPARTSSLSSLKSIRKVKLYLQRAVPSEDDESECEDHDLALSDDLTSGSEIGDARLIPLGVKKRGGDLDNIKEELVQD